MLRVKLTAVVAASCWLLAAALPSTDHLLQSKRGAASDLEITGMVKGLAPDGVRYVSYEDLLGLPLVTVKVRGDDNLSKNPDESVAVTGVYLDVLANSLGADSGSDMIVARCVDGYRANFSNAYIQLHRPIFVLKVDGLRVRDWVAKTHHDGLGSYFITYESFTPSFKVLSQSEMAQIPVEISRLNFNSAKAILGAIAPRGEHASDPQVIDGYRIAQQNCYRCHNKGIYGGTKASKSWEVLGNEAVRSPSTFERYIHDPWSVNPKSKMPKNAGFDEATEKALQAYFKLFSKGGK
jgi:mono/diheme cytochrome c family protein